MADTTLDRNHIFETYSASGTVYLTLDSQPVFWHRFQEHIKINVVYDKAVPELANDSAQIFSFISDGQISYNSVCCSNLPSPNKMEVVSPAGYSHTEADSDINYADNIPPANFENQTTGDGTTGGVTETTNSVQDLVQEEFDCVGSLTSEAEHSSIVISKPPSIDVSESEVESVAEAVKGEKPFGNGESEGITENDFKGSKRTSERLSHITLKISKNSLSPAVLKEKARGKKYTAKVKKNKVKVKEHNVKTKQKSKESAVKIQLTRLEKTYENNRDNDVKKTEDCSKSGKLKTKSRESTDRPRVPKLRKLELEKDVNCEYCSQTFKSQQLYFDHRKGERANFKCKVCSKIVPFKAHLMVHMRKHDNSNLQEEFLPLVADSLSGQSSESEPIGNTGDSKSSRQIRCDICGLTVSNIPILKTHTMIHTGEYAYKCCVCGEKTHSIAKHNNHLATHLKSGKVLCKICNISFESRSDLSRHQLTHEFKCNICDTVFPNKTSRVFHYKMAHKDDILKCQVCGKMFSSEEELAPHLKYHRNRAKTQCTVCGLFVTRLDNHILSHSQRSEDCRMYVCDQCPKQFKQKLSFQRHLRTHSEEKPYACMECPKRFARSGGLRRHMITHTQEKPFVCDVCGKACSQMGNLRIHMQIHKDSSLVQCKVCGEHFSYKNRLQEHMRTTHYVDMSSVDTSVYMPVVAPTYFT